MLTSRLTVRRRSSRRTFQSTQQLRREWLLLGRVVWWKVIDEEVVPEWASIQRGCLGYTSWRSKFAEYIR